ncbi:MAG TPA: AAA family ATPase [Candidatus Acidoferrum sp.]|nr:AAA family ATPase [Candidatus Acidoferrum sp.]
MFLKYYNLADQPFGVTPDMRYLYHGPTYREALASLAYGVQSGRGFMSLIAKPGMGKTTLLLQLLPQLERSARTVFLFQTLCGPVDLLRSILKDLGKEAQSSDLADMHSQLNDCLLAEVRRGKRVVVVIDEAQNLSNSTLELLRMLSNFETSREKLIQIILAGQPQLAERLLSPTLVQLRQRISIVARLKALTLQETNLYVAHRLRIAGYDSRTPVFTRHSMAMIAEHSGGIPRNINNICFNALSLGCALKRTPIDDEVICEVVNDLDFSSQELGLANGTATTIREPGIPDSTASTVVAKVGVGTYGWHWLSRGAAAAMLSLLLMWLLGGSRRGTKVPASDVSPGVAISAAASFSRSPLNSSSVNDAQNSDVVARDSSAPKGPVLTNARSRSVLPSKAAETSRRVEWRSGKTRVMNSETDPAKLWKQVENKSTTAEVALANLYLDGIVVPQNCAQAQVLLSAASQKGSQAAKTLLSTYEKRCD